MDFVGGPFHLGALYSGFISNLWFDVKLTGLVQGTNNDGEPMDIGKYASFCRAKGRGIFSSGSIHAKWGLPCACVSVDFAGGPFH